jgi:hypothetical protein
VRSDSFQAAIRWFSVERRCRSFGDLQARLVSEAHRIRLAHLFDPVLAVHTSVVEPLPHQITAVYESMLPRQPLRFLLADDPGAGNDDVGSERMSKLHAHVFRNGLG